MAKEQTVCVIHAADFQPLLRWAAKTGWHLLTLTEQGNGFSGRFERDCQENEITIERSCDLAARNTHAVIRATLTEPTRRIQQALDLVQELMPWRQLQREV